ncbi:hypothetical protein ACFH04_05710 [Streptomyces noboritoensis]|uniref:Uncharacterized protein n=1 Tax=Streptomyces noboritoensis TaxID=67337 RepID=A0ABV6TBU4_9ACTN
MHLEGGVLLRETLDGDTSFSWSPLDLGSMATWMTGAGKSMDSRMTGFFSSHSVSRWWSASGP